MTFQDALERLPHGPEFRFIEHLIALEPGKSGTAEYRVRGEEPFLRGHFPGEPLFPGVLLVEGCAQLAGVVAQSDPQYAPLPGLRLTAIRSAKIFGTVGPGATIRFEAAISGRLGNLVQAQVKATGAPGVLLEAAVTLSGDPS